MKKLSLIIAAGCLALATPVFACPGHDSADTKTAEKEPAKDTKAPAKETNSTAKKDAPKAKETTETAKAKDAPKKDAPKKPEKVSQK